MRSSTHVGTQAPTAPVDISRVDVSSELGALLAYLNPPQQQYDLLADGAARLLLRLPSGPSPERALTVYFQMFARGYAIWQSSYHYRLIHEYFYGASLQALAEGGDQLSPALRELFAEFSLAMIAYTQCENAIISNDAHALARSATEALAHATNTLNALGRANLSDAIRIPVENYLRTNAALYRGLGLCAETYLAPESSSFADSARQTELSDLLALVRKNSRELYSELHAHTVFAARYAELRPQTGSELRIEQAELVLRSIGYLGERVVAALFDYNLDDAEIAQTTVKAACQSSGLLITAIRRTVLQDLFETSLGEKYLGQILLDISTEDGALSFATHDGQREQIYNVESVQVRVARFGSIAVEFGLTAEDASVSHLRVLESIISPHAGRFQPIWRTSPPDATRASTNFVDAYLKSQDWINRLQAAGDSAGARPAAASLGPLQAALGAWRAALVQLSAHFRAESPDQTILDSLSDDTPHARYLRGLYAALRECQSRLYDLVGAWVRDPSNQQLPAFGELAKLATRYFPEGLTFGYLTDIAEEIFERLSRFFSTLTPIAAPDACVYLLATDVTPSYDLTRVLSFDPSTGWQAIISCNALAITPAESASKRDIGNDSRQFLTHPDFKGLLIQNREARASIDDWRFVAEPEYHNLATIRSHETDLMVLGQNRCLLFLPDDPQYLVAQYVASAAIVGDIRTIVLAFNVNAKEQIAVLEELTQNIQADRSSGLKASREVLSRQRERIEVFRTNVDQVLDLLRSYTISKYQDHSELLKAMIRDSGVQDFTVSLERNIDTLDRFHAYLTELIQRKIEEREQSNQGIITWLLLILSFLSGLSAIDPIATVVSRVVGSTHQRLIEDALYSAVGLFVLVGGILLWLRSRDV